MNIPVRWCFLSHELQIHGPTICLASPLGYLIGKLISTRQSSWFLISKVASPRTFSPPNCAWFLHSPVLFKSATQALHILWSLPLSCRLVAISTVTTLDHDRDQVRPPVSLSSCTLLMFLLWLLPSCSPSSIHSLACILFKTYACFKLQSHHFSA